MIIDAKTVIKQNDLQREYEEIMEGVMNILQGKNLGAVVPCLASLLCQTMADANVPKLEATAYIAMCIAGAYELVDEIPDQVH
jgi:hypothetical protein